MFDVRIFALSGRLASTAHKKYREFCTFTNRAHYVRARARQMCDQAVLLQEVQCPVNRICGRPSSQRLFIGGQQIVCAYVLLLTAEQLQNRTPSRSELYAAIRKSFCCECQRGGKVRVTGRFTHGAHWGMREARTRGGYPQNAFVNPTYKPRRGPNWGAPTPMPEPSRIS